MKRLATIFIGALLLFGGMAQNAQAQDESDAIEAPQVPYILLFEDVTADTSFFNASYLQSDASFFEYSSASEIGVTPHQGDGALAVNWEIYANANSSGYAGSSGLGHNLPDSYQASDTTEERLYDISDFTDIHFWYYVAQAPENDLSLRFKLHDASLGIGTAGNSETEDWTATPVGPDGNNPLAAGVAPGWQEITIPLDNLGIQNPSENGFSRPGCTAGGDPEAAGGCWSGLLGNEEFDLDQISGFQFEFFSPTSVRDEDSTDAGVIVFDDMNVSGVRYDLLSGFDSADDFGGFDNGSTSSSRTYVDTDSVQGTGAMELDYDVTGDASWGGGSADVQVLSSGEAFPNMSQRSALSLFYKVEDDLEGEADFTFKVFDANDASGGDREQWHYTTSEVLSDTSDGWQRLVIPFDELAIPSYQDPPGNGSLDLGAVNEIQFQVIVGDGGRAQGTILFDRLTSYGEAEIDLPPPPAVEGLSASASSVLDYRNTVNWSDLDDREEETYNIYYSLSPITDLESDNVYLAAADVAEGTETYQHRIFHPKNDGEVTYYYAIRATDGIGQQSPFSAAPSAVTNTGMGIPTISLGAPDGFAADGDLSDWNDVMPFSLDPDGEGLGYIPQTDANFAIDDAQDLSVDFYLAAGDDALYFAYDVTDNTYVPVPDDDANGDPADTRYFYDGGEIYIGLYNETNARHAGAARSGVEPDYKFYIYPQGVEGEGIETDNPNSRIITPDGSDYYFQTTGENGNYVVEGRLPYEAFSYEDAPAFEPQNGMRIPLDFLAMDNDEPSSVNREGILAYSFWNNDNSYLSPRNWFYTWIGDQMTVPVDEPLAGAPERYKLHQNFPNPVGSETVVRYELPEPSEVTIQVYNLLGQKVRTLVDSRKAAGVYDAPLQAKNLAAGVYFYQLRAGDYVQSKKMVIVQ